MKMKETVGSMRAYLALVGVVTGALYIGDLVRWWSEAPLVVPFAIIGLGLSLAMLYAGVFLRRLLKQSPTAVICIVLAITGYFAMSSLLIALVAGIGLFELVRVVIAALIALYLVANARRLSSELRGEQA